MILNPLTCAVAWGPPQRHPHLQALDMVRTMTTAIGDLRDVRTANPGCHQSLVIQLGEFPRWRHTDAGKVATSLRQRYALLAHEQFPTLVVDPDDAPAAMRSQWWGLAALRLDDTRSLDEYLREVGTLIADWATDDIHLVDSIHVDTAAWTMPEKRGFLGCGLAGPDLESWIIARCEAFASGYLSRPASRIPLTVNGISSFSLRLGDIAAGYGLERFGTNGYHRDRYPSVRDYVIAQYQQAVEFLRHPPAHAVGLVVNPIPYAFDEREHMLTFLRAHAILYKALQAEGSFRRVPVYWQVERDTEDQDVWVQDDYPLVWQQILAADWPAIQTPMDAQCLVRLKRGSTRVELAIDDTDRIKITRVQ